MIIIVSGSYYRGRKQQIIDRSYCSICERENRPLRSYSAWEIGHFMFIPLMPWGRVRIFCSCLTCQHHYKFSLKGKRLKAAIEQQRKDAFARLGKDLYETLNDVAGLAHLGDFEGVRSLLEKLDDHGQAARTLGEARFLALQGRASEAESNFQKALKADPSSGTPDFWLGQFLLTQKRDEEAIAQLQRAAQLNPHYEYFGLLRDFSLARKQRKNWHGLAVIMSEMARRQPDMTKDRKFARLYAKACRKSGRIAETSNPYANP